MSGVYVVNSYASLHKKLIFSTCYLDSQSHLYHGLFPSLFSVLNNLILLIIYKEKFSDKMLLTIKILHERITDVKIIIPIQCFQLKWVYYRTFSKQPRVQ